MARLGEKLVKAFHQQELCDLEISLSDGSIMDAHRTVLILGSDWFRTCLNENWDPKQSKRTVICHDFLPSQTRSVIEFLYQHEIDLSFENVEDMLQAAQFYMVSDLSEKCLDFLQQSICFDKALLVLHIAHKFGLKNVVLSSLLYIDKFARDILSNSPANEMFFQYPVDLINLLLERNTLCIHEEKLFLLIVKWMNSECRNVSETWRKIVPNIRFGRMSATFFIENVVYRNIISDDFAMKVMLYLNSLSVCKDTVGPAFQSRACVSEEDIRIIRFFSKSPSNTWKCDELNGDRLVFSVNRNIQFHGIILYGNYNVSLLVEVSLSCDENILLKEKIREELTEECEFSFIFANSVTLEKDKLYTVAVHMSGCDVYFGIDGLTTVQTIFEVNKTVTVTFSDSICSLTNSRRGQIKGIILH
ncbi:BTB/POZ domain-containing protein 1-like [Saccostrea echinata]|uniref:BTB/POZ domain-containing protein 1-like n=1 Tax=Saccostrea echinata TaxID=191078 RepID=UPI002A81BE44|nr:BTB/POZ domain-containing protein 1-like [Saccostrea echinata]XP_061175962.1 BTB/POZ domain-containing protein 1-like [Saccostrea echinata]XP_061175963.1 BTB/POZ domain-containing protein 1-like [Saccostrea echinata]